MEAPPLIFRHFSLEPILTYTLILSLVLLIATLAGIQFRCSGDILNKSPQQISSSLYSADLLGSAAGTLLVTIILVPMLGIHYSLISLAGLNLLTGIWLMIRRKKLVLD